MSLSQKILDGLIYQNVFIDRYGRSAAQRILKLLLKLDPIIERELLDALDNLNVYSLTLSQIEAALEPINELYSTQLEKSFSELQSELEEFSSTLNEKQYSLFTALIPVEILSQIVFVAASESIIAITAAEKAFQGRLLSEWAAKLAETSLNKIVQTVYSGYVEGLTNQQIARKIMGTKKNKYKDGILEINRKNVNSIVRTAVSHYASTTRAELFKENEEYIKGQVWCSTLDTRTTKICIARDGKEYTLTGKPIGHELPYLGGAGKAHFCCRSTMVPILKSWKDMGFDFKELKPSTRASMDGQVPEDTKYSDWLQRQSFERQVQVLGKERAKLLQDGVTVEKMFTDNGEFLTLEQLKQIL
ncbi:phage minor head protein [Thorsellia anophelis]|uniref:Phage putative head morphogenesis protein, SPP1 gp7 family n=1 Tax=Thorsellia anophelis DSM 18579 TaxID=1123402 RepID=A0A1I0D7Y7_9GAMM|nr:phage minor head protein [Thorsellia anophelis]SET28382.1 phage putative head morphogenesis protein, SPP1 gp7 family [Thorsellia anophelis DSM 18579]